MFFASPNADDYHYLKECPRVVLGQDLKSLKREDKLAPGNNVLMGQIPIITVLQG